ncbi:hypothetical protein IV203_036789 [Nitzschia inconspicua]|uniref:Uncharacterized protein n=1 Tax=Nitzschia inconspicua TaxID=303405 RepID=A0A9K3LGP4_9STRA|nr:hypothetical protein IV203_036789 [Nitzschia inconspicua]
MDQQGHRSLDGEMLVPGPRVAILDRKEAVCSATYNYDLSVPMENTVIQYFYAIESTEIITIKDVQDSMLVRRLEETLFRAIHPAILWCYYDDSTIGKRHLEEKTGDLHGRRMTLEEARRLSIVTFSTTPEDEETSIPCNFPTESEFCVVMKGMMTIIHHITSDVSLATASILDACQTAMDNSETVLLEGNEAFENITNIIWLGETEEDAINGGVLPPGGAAVRQSRAPIAYAVSVPLLILMALALFVARNRTQREALTSMQVLALESANQTVLVGTGDPPRSFHEGLHHYTRHGARYLSTNCPQCIETKLNGYFTDSDLETIQEGNFESFEEISLVATNVSAHGKEDSEHDPSDHRKRNLVQASDGALGVKHSSIDVHQCTSSLCPICTYRPADVSFIGNSEVSSPTLFGPTSSL